MSAPQIAKQRLVLEGHGSPCKDFSVIENIELTREYFSANRLSYKSY